MTDSDLREKLRSRCETIVREGDRDNSLLRECYTAFIMEMYKARVITAEECKAYIKSINFDFYKKILHQEALLRDCRTRRDANEK